MFLSVGTFAQEVSEFRVKKSVPGYFSSFAADNLGNIYPITNDNQLKKYSAKGDSMGVFNNVRKYGKLSYIDITNPLKTLLFYKDFRTILVLDRFLNVVNNIDLRKQSVFQVRAIALAYDNNIWVFDEQDLKLKKINEEGNLVLESADMRQLTDSVPSPQQIIDSDNMVYLYDDKKGFYIFDYYGALKNSLSFLNWTDVAISGSKVMGFSENNLLSYQLKSLNLKTYQLPSFFRNHEAIKAVNGKVYLLKKDSIDIYSIQ